MKKRSYTTVPAKPDQLLAQGDLVAAALVKLQSEVGVKQNTAKAVQKDLATYRTADTVFQSSVANRINQLTPEQKEVDALAADLIKQTKGIVSREFGAIWSQPWSQVGYINPTLRMPKHRDERAALLERIGTFLADNPRFENEKLGVTSERALELHGRFTGVRSNVKDRKTGLADLSDARKLARKNLQKRLRALVGELNLLLPADDSRWHAFGLTPPAERRAALKAAREAKKAAAAAETGATETKPATRPTTPAASQEASDEKAALNG